MRKRKEKTQSRQYRAGRYGDNKSGKYHLLQCDFLFRIPPTIKMDQGLLKQPGTVPVIEGEPQKVGVHSMNSRGGPPGQHRYTETTA